MARRQAARSVHLPAMAEHIAAVCDKFPLAVGPSLHQSRVFVQIGGICRLFAANSSQFSASRPEKL